MSKRRHRPADARSAKRRLRMVLAAFFIGLALPVYLLLDKTYSQLENEAYFNQRLQAEQAAQRIERHLLEIIEAEQKRPIAEYSFFNLLENPLLQSASVNLSPLAEIPPRSAVPGISGYFQIAPDGTFSTPALPELDNNPSGLSAAELQKRIALRDKLRDLLAADQQEKRDSAGAVAAGSNRPVEVEEAIAAQKTKQAYRFDASPPAPVDDSDASSARSQTINPAKDREDDKKARKLSDEQLKKLNIDAEHWRQAPKRAAGQESNYLSRKEQVRLPSQSPEGLFERPAAPAVSSLAKAKQQALPEQRDTASETTAGQKPIRVLSFESEVGPLRLLRLDTEHFCFYRQVWRNNSRYVQGFIVNGGEFFSAALRPLLGDAQAAWFSSALLAYDGALLQQFKLTPAPREILLYRMSLTAPLDNVELIVNSGPATAPPGALLIDMLAAALGAVLCIGAVVFYRLGAGQIDLAQRQRNFISAVSHELKTPLTSIRMYAEMLRAEWINDPAKQKSYYDFIFFESERLSRLIANVLQLAKLDNHRETAKLVNIAPQQLLQRMHGKIAAQVEAAGFGLNLMPGATQPENLSVAVDEDAFYQIFINLVDNALKFSADAEKRSIDVGLRLSPRDREALFFVRDYGPGIERKQMKKIFQLFYRPGDELTRAKPGTGIGLALVVQLAERMQAQIDVLNRDPGAEFQVKLRTALAR